MPVLERAGQITAVVDAVTRARTGVGSLLLVAGEAGVGKTTLVRAALDRLPGEVGRWWGACDPLATPRPLGPWEDMALRQPTLASVLHSDDRAVVGSGVLSLLGEATVVVVEDVHWVDEATTDLLLYLGRRLERCRSVIVVTYRPVDVAADHPAARLLGLLARSPDARTLRLDPLSQDAVARLADGSGLDPGVLHRRTGGNPFYVTELLADPARTVPGTVADAVRARLGELPPHGRELLDLVCLAPSGLEYTVAAEVLGEQPTETGLDQVAARGMAGLTGGRITFRHELARIAVAEALPPGRRRRLHAQLLATLEDLPGVDAARLVHHAELAGDRERLLAHAPAAADAAEARDAHRAAAAHLERAINVAGDLPPRDQAELWTRLAAAVGQFDSTARVIEVHQQAVVRWHAVGDVDGEVHQLCGLADAYNSRETRTAAREAIARAAELMPDSARGPAALDLRTVQLRQSDSQRPARVQLPAWEQLAADARREGVPWSIFEASWSAAEACAQLGDVRRALDLADTCAQLARRDLPRTTGKAECNIGEALSQGRHYKEAERLLGTAIRLCRDRDMHHTEAAATAVHARVHLERGNWGQARTMAETLAEPLAEAVRGLVDAVLARLDAHQGVADAIGRLDTAWRTVSDTEELDFMWPVAVAVAEAAWVGGEPATATDAILATLDVARATEHPWAVGELTCWARQTGHDVPVTIEIAEPWAAALAGDWAAAADTWADLGCPLDQAIALTAGDPPAQRRALDLFIELGATADADRLRQRLRAAGETDLPARDRPRAAPDSVTARQLEVLELVATGLTNAAIAKRLYITEKTVGHHVSAILTRLDARTRTQAVTTARQRGLLPD